MTKPKIIAFYLPQYHTIPENDEWWGKGFTEWTNVKKAKPMFFGHNQPRVPLNDNYYDLMNPNTFTWQVELANQYGIDGFCFYHYWFNGKLLLEKPLEMYLEHKEWNKNYCFSWANEPWARTWDGQNKNVLMPQEYDGERDINNHFNYMLPFFKDERYMKIGNKPIFVIYRANSITYFEDMIKIWNVLAQKNGFDGIYFVETLTSYSSDKYSENTQATVYMEPMYVLSQRNKFTRIMQTIASPIKRNKRISYRYLWNKVCKEETVSEISWAGAFVDWDNSARKKKRNLVLTGTNFKSFKKYFCKTHNKVISNNCPFIFINAWNEWAEGTYLEPDVKNEYGYLKIIQQVVEQKE